MLMNREQSAGKWGGNGGKSSSFKVEKHIAMVCQ
jgi:hypothetical protein